MNLWGVLLGETESRFFLLDWMIGEVGGDKELCEGVARVDLEGVPRVDLEGVLGLDGESLVQAIASSSSGFAGIISFGGFIVFKTTPTSSFFSFDIVEHSSEIGNVSFMLILISALKFSTTFWSQLPPSFKCVRAWMADMLLPFSAMKTFFFFSPLIPLATTFILYWLWH